MNAVKHASEATFAQVVLQSPTPVLVDFYADWCGPCRRLAPTLERLAVEFAGRATIVKFNVDEEPALAEQFRIESIPTLVLFSGGKVVGRATGLAPEAGLRNALQQLVSVAA